MKMIIALLVLAFTACYDTPAAPMAYSRPKDLTKILPRGLPQVVQDALWSEENPTCTFKLPKYGFWRGGTVEEAQAREDADEEPDVVFSAGNWVSGSDGIIIAEENWPGQYVVGIVSFHAVH